MSTARKFGQWPYPLNYHPRSDHHSKVSCWAIMFDLMRETSLLRTHVEQGKVAFGINHKIVDYARDREKDLDLVICSPDPTMLSRHRTLRELGAGWGVTLTADQVDQMDQLPEIQEAGVGSILMTLEAKACMTEYGKARPRLYDELNSSQSIVHGGSSHTLAVGLVMINTAGTFFSPLRNKHLKIDSSWPAEVTVHQQPADTEKTLRTIESLPRRTGNSGRGYDAIGVLLVDCPNDGGRVSLYQGPLSPAPGSTFEYGSMIRRMSGEYSSRFAGL
ncbi:MAG: hypothetical protein WCF36_16425 [Candidatus Nanopelagicales bacterium]